jgi:hypothetical protein
MRRRVLRNFGPVLLADDSHPLKAAASNFAGCSADELIADPERLFIRKYTLVRGWHRNLPVHVERATRNPQSGTPGRLPRKCPGDMSGSFRFRICIDLSGVAFRTFYPFDVSNGGDTCTNRTYNL